MKSVKMFGKSVPLLTLVIVSALVAGVGAALLGHYGTIRTSTDVSQSVVFLVGRDPTTTVTDSFEVIAGNSQMMPYVLWNRASVPAFARLETLPVEAGITVSYGYDLKMLEDSNNIEKIWVSGGPVEELPDGDKLEILVTYEGHYVVFKAIPPVTYEADDMTFTFDVGEEGTADFQVQYDEGLHGGWMYSGVTDMQWDKDDPDSGWSSVPAIFVTEINSREFTLKVPIPTLGGFGAGYKFGVQTNQPDPEGPLHQIFYSTVDAHIPGNDCLWYDTNYPGSYVHSTYYVPMTVGKALPDPFEIAGKTELPFYILYESLVHTEEGTYSFGTIVHVVP